MSTSWKQNQHNQQIFGKNFATKTNLNKTKDGKYTTRIIEEFITKIYIQHHLLTFTYWTLIAYHKSIVSMNQHLR